MLSYFFSPRFLLFSKMEKRVGGGVGLGRRGVVTIVMYRFMCSCLCWVDALCVVVFVFNGCSFVTHSVS
jgi:hypothetical protein